MSDVVCYCLRMFLYSILDMTSVQESERAPCGPNDVSETSLIPFAEHTALVVIVLAERIGSLSHPIS